MIPRRHFAEALSVFIPLLQVMTPEEVILVQDLQFLHDILIQFTLDMQRTRPNFTEY